MVSKAADKLEQIAAYMDLIGRTDYAGFLRNVAALVRACEVFTKQLNIIHDDPRYLAVWMSFQNHSGVYTGPKYVDEFDAMQAALAKLQEQHK